MAKHNNQKVVGDYFIKNWQKYYKSSDMEMSKVNIFFNNLLYSKEPVTKNDDLTTEEAIWVFKRLSAMAYFGLGKLYQKFITWITRYYPFSLLYTDKIYHSRHQHLRLIINKIEKLIAQFGIKALIVSNEVNENYTVYKTLFSKKPDPNQLAHLETNLQNKLGSVYIRIDRQSMNILLPNEVLNNI